MTNESRVLSLVVERGGKIASYEVHGGVALVGSGSHCDVRLLPEDAGAEQLRVELVGEPVTQCSASGARETAFHASRLIREANLQSERAPFYPRDGVSAVGRYEEAAACLSHAGRTAEAKTLSQAAVALRDSLSDQFHVRHVRLERFLSVKKYDAAQREVRVLQDFFSRREGPYAQWLAGVQRELNTRFARAKRKG